MSKFYLFKIPIRVKDHWTRKLALHLANIGWYFMVPLCGILVVLTLLGMDMAGWIWISFFVGVGMMWIAHLLEEWYKARSKRWQTQRVKNFGRKTRRRT